MNNTPLSGHATAPTSTQPLEQRAVIRQFLLLFVSGAVLLFALVLGNAYHFEQIAVETQTLHEDAEIALATERIQQDMAIVSSDLEVLVDIFGIDHKLAIERTEDRLNVTELYRVLLKGTRLYDQIRFVDSQGMERIRVSLNDGEPVVVPENQLHDKSGRYYVRDILELQRGEAYVSPLELNMKLDRIEMPPKPMLHFGAPVFDADGRKLGFVLLNHLGARLLAHFRASVGLDGCQGMLLNSDGYWLSSPNPGDEWGFMFGNGHTFGQVYPEEWKVIASHEKGAIHNARGLFVYSTVYPLQAGQHSSTGSMRSVGISDRPLGRDKYFWRIVTYTPDSVLPSIWFSQQPMVLTLLLFALALLAAGSWLLARAIASRARWAESLRKSESLFSIVFRSSPIGIVISRVDDGYMVDVNSAFLETLGYAREDIVNHFALDISTWANIDDRRIFVERLRREGRIRNQEIRFRKKTGEIGFALVSIERLDLDGVPHMLSMLIDFTERKHMEEDLSRAEEWLRLAQQAANVGSWEYDVETQRENWSPQMATIYGIEPGQALNHSDWLACIHPDDSTRVQAEEGQALAEQRPFLIEYRIVKPSGEVRWVDGRGGAVLDAGGRIIRVLGVDIDITERKQSELSMQEQENFTRAILNAVSTHVAVIDGDGVIVAVNESWRRFALENSDVAGRPATSTDIGTNYLDICAAARGSSAVGAQDVLNGIRMVLAGDSQAFSYEYPCHAPGMERWFMVTVAPLDGARTGAVISHIDITAPRQLAEKLRENEERFRLLFENAPVGMAMVDDRRRFFHVNRAMCEMLGYDEADLIGKTFDMITHSDDIAANLDRFQQAHKDQVSSYNLRKRYLHRDGGTIWVNLFAAPIRSSSGASLYSIGIVENVTAQVNAEQERLAHEASQRNALVREVHHRIKNNLQGVIGLLRQDIASFPGAAVPIESAIAQINTISVVYGLQSRLNEYELHLSELVWEVVKAAASLAVVDATPSIEASLVDDVCLDRNATVSIALILNELLQNALKHGRHKNGFGVTVSISGDVSHLIIRIDNPGGPLPSGFNLASGAGCGIGLDLVRTLLPRKGAHLAIYEDAEMVRAELMLMPPLITQSITCCTPGQ